LQERKKLQTSNRKKKQLPRGKEGRPPNGRKRKKSRRSQSRRPKKDRVLGRKKTPKQSVTSGLAEPGGTKYLGNSKDHNGAGHWTWRGKRIVALRLGQGTKKRGGLGQSGYHEERPKKRGHKTSRREKDLSRLTRGGKSTPCEGQGVRKAEKAATRGHNFAGNMKPVGFSTNGIPCVPGKKGVTRKAAVRDQLRGGGRGEKGGKCQRKRKSNEGGRGRTTGHTGPDVPEVNEGGKRPRCCHGKCDQ